MSYSKIKELLGSKADLLLNHESKTVLKEHIHQPGPGFVDSSFIGSNRSRNNGWKITKGEETLYLRIEDEEEEKTQIRKENFGHPLNPLALSLSLPYSDSL